MLDPFFHVIEQAKHIRRETKGAHLCSINKFSAWEVRSDMRCRRGDISCQDRIPFSEKFFAKIAVVKYILLLFGSFSAQNRHDIPNYAN